MSVDPSARFPNVHMMGRALLPFASPAGRRHWSTLFTAAPRPIKDPSPSMAIVAPPVEPQATVVELTRTRDASAGPALHAISRDTTIETAPARASALVESSISIVLSGEIESPARPSVAPERIAALPPEPNRPPETPASLAAPRATYRSRAVNPRSLAVAAALAGVAVVGVAIAVTSRSSPKVPSAQPPIPAALAQPAPTSLPRPVASPPTAAPAVAPQAPAVPPTLPETHAAPEASPPRATRPSDEKRRHRSQRIRRDENGFPIIE
jgi:hypothetical protein